MMSKSSILVVLILGLVVMASVADAAKKKKSSSSTLEKASDTTAASNNNNNNKEKPKKKSWHEMTADDWRRLEREGDDDDVDLKKKKAQEKNAKPFDPNNIGDFMKQSQKGKSKMGFHGLVGGKEARTKEQAEKLASSWKLLLQSNAVDATSYVIDNGMLLWQTDGSYLDEVRRFALEQPETAYFEVDNKRVTREEHLARKNDL